MVSSTGPGRVEVRLGMLEDSASDRKLWILIADATASDPVFRIDKIR
jgi:hypothetical protein